MTSFRTARLRPPRDLSGAFCPSPVHACLRRRLYCRGSCARTRIGLSSVFVSAMDAGTRPPDRSDATGSAWTPFRHRTFTVLWMATVVSNVGVWMQNAAAGWLMTTLDPDPFVVSMVQFAANFPMFLFALPAGAIADIVDRRSVLPRFDANGGSGSR